MSWTVLVLSGVLEAVWATALGKSEGFSRLGPSAVFVGALSLSMAGLAYAMRDLPIAGLGHWLRCCFRYPLIELRPVKLFITAAECEQFGMCAALDDLTVLDDKDQVGGADR